VKACGHGGHEDVRRRHATAEMMLNARDGWAALTPDRVCSDILGVADAMGVRSFAFYGRLH
jgi:hypothetical protein